MKKHLFLAALLLWAACSSALHAQDIPTYFKANEMPDLIKGLPAPPAFGSQAFIADSLRYRWGK